MKRNNLVFFRPKKEVLIAFFVFIVCVLLNYISSLFTGTPLYYVFYEGVFVLGICILFPVWFTAVGRKQPLSVIGITTHQWPKAVWVGLMMAALTAGGRLLGARVPFPGMNALLYLIACMIMSTLFEEVFFRGFLQTQYEKSFGMIPAILLSALCYSLYHFGYSNVRGNMPELITLFCVGILFSISFRITRNIITSYIVNLPMAILTFLMDPISIAYRVRFDGTSAVISLITTLIGLFLIIFFYLKTRKETTSAAG